MITTAAILAGGLATRLRPITEKIPKILVEVAGRPFVDWQLELLQRKGFRRVVLCIGFLGEQVEALVGDGSAWGLEVRYSYDGPRQLGTGGALAQALPLLDHNFWVLYGDSYLDIAYRAISDFFEQALVAPASVEAVKPLGLMTVYANRNKWDTSNVIFSKGQLLEYNKWQPRPEMEYIDYGAAILQAEIFQPQASSKVEQSAFDLADLYQQMVVKGQMVGYEVAQRFYEIGSHSGLEEARSFFEHRGSQEVKGEK